MKKVDMISDQYTANPVDYRGKNINIIALKAIINDVSRYYSQHSASVMNSSYSGQGVVMNNPFSGKQAEISSLYTKLYVTSVILPGLKDYQSLQKKLDGIIDLSELNQLISQSMDNYIQRYIDNYYSFSHVLFSASVNNTEDLKIYLENIVSSNSIIYKGLKYIKENTEFDDGEFKIITSKFSFLNDLYKNYENSDFVLYLNSIYNTVYGGYSLSLQMQNKRLVKLVYGYYGNIEDNPLNKVKSWLPITVSSVIRDNFTVVFNQIIRIGLNGIRRNIQEIWQTQLQTLIDHLDSFYPLIMTSDKVIDVKTLDQSVNPKSGYFWQVFDQWLKPFLIYTPNGWINNQSVVNQGLLSSHQLAQVNRMMELSKNFWQANGQPKVLNIKIYPEKMMNRQLENKNFVNMSFLKVGQDTVIGINVFGISQTVAYAWWKEQSCSVGYQTSSGSTVNIFNDYTPLCLFKLMSKAKTNNGTYQWQDKQSDIRVAYRLTGLGLEV
ncbi:hypothetical protein [Piscirickettsia litoralis]|uniref:Uncharacterized protein n=1 Tax=Piscirickettsia litoralis TaxID=1891921 RepID=A0ABX3A562_9GAMM|nr:hypothetical protein [Piscirickettsia litoralis]ODN42560.1 hypothetical protein BGC07_05980 [Piscirickettsia litoralis]